MLHLQDKAFVQCCRPALPAPGTAAVWLVGFPLVFLCKLFANVPPLLVLLGLLAQFGQELSIQNSFTDVLRCDSSRTCKAIS